MILFLGGGQSTVRDTSPCFYIPHYFILFYCCLPSLISVFFFRCVSHSLSLSSLLGTFLSASFCLFSLFFSFFFSDRVPGLIWFNSVYLVTNAGLVADQLMRDKYLKQQHIHYIMLLWATHIFTIFFVIAATAHKTKQDVRSHPSFPSVSTIGGAGIRLFRPRGDHPNNPFRGEDSMIP